MVTVSFERVSLVRVSGMACLLGRDDDFLGRLVPNKDTLVEFVCATALELYDINGSESCANKPSVSQALEAFPFVLNVSVKNILPTSSRTLEMESPCNLEILIFWVIVEPLGIVQTPEITG